MAELSFETLEPRELLSATVSFQGGTLLVRGDAASDAIRIDGDGYDTGTVEVFHDTDRDGTVDTSLGVFHGVKNIKVDGRGGSDAIGIYRVDIDGNVNVRLGTDRDGLFVLQSDIGGDVSIVNGGGGDGLQFRSNTIGGDVIIKSRLGNDDAQVFVNTVGGRLDFRLGIGNDTIALYNNTIGEPSILRGGPGRGDLFITNNQPDPENMTLKKVEKVLPSYPGTLGLELSGFYDDLLFRVLGINA
ncbi:MAG: hypothetical protein R3C01_03480 [Planctomycetaceae bacterium]